MSKFGAAVLTTLMLVATPVAATEVPQHISHDAAWGCRDKSDVVDLLFLGLSTSFDTKLATALADGRCVYFKAGESVIVVDPAERGLVRVQRPAAAGAEPVTYWMPSRNLN